MAVKRPLPSYFGPLELRVLETLCGRVAAASVRDLLADFPGVAYTTLMTTLDRLHKKGVLARSRDGRAFFYEPVASRERLEATLASKSLDALVASLSTRGAMRPLLTSFVDAVSRHDELALDELEQALRARRQQLRRDQGSGR